ncbi:MAG: hypothetical protein PHU25_11205 [Deltaproteobacteria bacterium]|nr:hypothetical protein [Deltaproteobacteria bacterium]
MTSIKWAIAVFMLGCLALSCDENGGLTIDASTSAESVVPDCVRYVDPDLRLIGDGLSWETAHNTVKLALVSGAEAVRTGGKSACEIWVKGDEELSGSDLDEDLPAASAELLSSGKLAVYRKFLGTEKTRGTGQVGIVIPANGETGNAFAGKRVLENSDLSFVKNPQSVDGPFAKGTSVSTADIQQANIVGDLTMVPDDTHDFPVLTTAISDNAIISGDHPYILLNDTGTNHNDWYFDDYSHGDLAIYATSNNNKSLYYDVSEGKFGINTWNPGSTLDVSGTFNVFGSANSDYIAKFFNDGNSYLDHGVIIQCGSDDSAGNAGTLVRFNDGNGDQVGRIQFYQNTLRMGWDTNDSVIMASNGNVGIGGSPETALTVVGSAVSHPSWSSSYDTLQIQNNNTYSVLDIVGPNSGTSEVIFSDSDDRMIGGIKYSHSDNSMQFFANGNSSEKMRIASNGNVGIGTSTPDYRLDIHGTIRAEEVIVESFSADFVFDDDYDPMPLDNVESYVKEYHHLPGVPSAAEVERNGVSLSDMQARLLQKVEELTLHAIDQNRRIQELEARVAECR